MFRERNTAWVAKSSELDRALSDSSGESMWIVTRPQWTQRLVGALTHSTHHRLHRPIGDLLMLRPPVRSELIPPLRGYFRRIVGDIPSLKMLPAEQLAEVVSMANRSDLFIAGSIDETTRSLTLIRGDLSTVTVPLSIFLTSGATKPDFARFQLDDYGYAVRFGEYEASAHKVLYEADPEYRKRFGKIRPKAEREFGASLRRLRLLRRLSIDDFPGVPATRIANLELGVTLKPRRTTLNALAKVLDVEPDDIETY